MKWLSARKLTKSHDFKQFKIQAGFSGLIDRNAWLHFSQIIQLTYLYLLTDLPNTSNSNSLCFCIDTKWMKITWKPTWVSPWESRTRSRQWRSWTPWSQCFRSCLRRNFGTHSKEVSSFTEGFWWFEKILIFILTELPQQKCLHHWQGRIFHTSL